MFWHLFRSTAVEFIFEIPFFVDDTCATRSDLQSLDFFELTERAVTLVEWPDRLNDALVTLPGALEIDIQMQDETGRQDVEKITENGDSDNEEGEGELTEAMMEEWISQPRSVRLTVPVSSSVWSQFTL